WFQRSAGIDSATVLGHPTSGVFDVVRLGVHVRTVLLHAPVPRLDDRVPLLVGLVYPVPSWVPARHHGRRYGRHAARRTPTVRRGGLRPGSTAGTPGNEGDECHRGNDHECPAQPDVSTETHAIN